MALFRTSKLTTPTGETTGHKAGKKSGQTATSTARAAVALCKAKQKLIEVIPAVPRGGQSIHFATAGNWSTHDLVLHLVRLTGPAHMTMATWSITEAAIRPIVAALKDGGLLSLNLLADWNVTKHCPDAIQLARANATNFRLAGCHAKVAVLHNAKPDLTIVGSANLTTNPRIEAGVLTADKTAANFHRAWIMSEITNANPFEIPPTAATKKRRKPGDE